MRVTRGQLRRIIREEARALNGEALAPDGTGAERSRQSKAGLYSGALEIKARREAAAGRTAFANDLRALVEDVLDQVEDGYPADQIQVEKAVAMLRRAVDGIE